MFTASGPGLETRIEQFAESEGAVVQGVSASGAVVTVEVALAVPHSHPVGHQCGESTPEQPCQLHHLAFKRKGGIDLIAVVALDQVLNDQRQFIHRARMGLGPHPSGEQFDLPHPKKGGGNPGADRGRVVHHHIRFKAAGLLRVPGPPHNFRMGHVKGQGAGTGDSEGLHELLGQEFTHA